MGLENINKSFVAGWLALGGIGALGLYNYYGSENLNDKALEKLNSAQESVISYSSGKEQEKVLDEAYKTVNFLEENYRNFLSENPKFDKKLSNIEQEIKEAKAVPESELDSKFAYYQEHMKPIANQIQEFNNEYQLKEQEKGYSFFGGWMTTITFLGIGLYSATVRDEDMDPDLGI